MTAQDIATALIIAILLIVTIAVFVPKPAKYQRVRVKPTTTFPNKMTYTTSNTSQHIKVVNIPRKVSMPVDSNQASATNNAIFTTYEESTTCDNDENTLHRKL